MNKKINKIIIDIGHPAHVHLFKNFAKRMLEKGCEILFTCREREHVLELLNHYGFNYKSFGQNYTSLSKKAWGLIKFDVMQFLNGLRFKPDLFLSHSSMYSAHASFLLRKPHISLEDTFNFEQIRLYEPFTEVILTADYDHPLKSKKVIKYSGYHELAYLHPNHFKPDINIFSELNLSENEKYVIIRFVSWNATHDVGHCGISLENKIKTVNEFKKYAKIFISSESQLPKELEVYKIPILPNRMHDAIALSTLVFGESTTMAEEAAMLGVPACIIYKRITHYTHHLENNYNLLYNFTLEEQKQIKAIEKGIELLTKPNIKNEWQRRREKMLREKIDVTAFLVWFIENYPESVRVMRENPAFQFNFK